MCSVVLLYLHVHMFYVIFVNCSLRFLLFLVAVLNGLDPTVIPIIRSIFSKLVLQNDQGEPAEMPMLYACIYTNHYYTIN